MNILAFLGLSWWAWSLALLIATMVAMSLTFMSERRKPALIPGAIVFTTIFAMICLFKSYTLVNYNEVGLITRYNALTGRVLQPGLSWVSPFIDNVVRVPTIIQSYETSDYPNESKANFNDVAISAQTVDGQQVSIKYTVIFRIPSGEDAVRIYQNVGPLNMVVENVVKANSRSLARTLAQKYQAEQLYSGSGIVEYQTELTDALGVKFAEYGFGLTLQEVLIRKIDFTDEYVDAIENQQIAQEQIKTAQYQSEAAKYQRDQAITMAEADAEKIRLNAKANADSKRIEAEAEAYAIEQQGAALRENPEMLQWEFISKLGNVSWGIMPDNAVTPLLQMPNTVIP